MEATRNQERPAQGRTWSSARHNQAATEYALPQICTGTLSRGSQEKSLDG